MCRHKNVRHLCDSSCRRRENPHIRIAVQGAATIRLMIATMASVEIRMVEEYLGFKAKRGEQDYPTPEVSSCAAGYRLWQHMKDVDC